MTHVAVKVRRLMEKQNRGAERFDRGSPLHARRRRMAEHGDLGNHRNEEGDEDERWMCERNRKEMIVHRRDHL